MKSTRQIVLSQRIKPGEGKVEDIKGRLASRFGTAVHDSIEMSWVNNYKTSMADMGYPPAVVDRVRINPTDPDEPDIIPVYMEQRFHKEVGDWIVSGQFDFVGDGRLEDFKSTGTYTWVNGTKDDDYVAQGSIYRWGRPDIITQETMAIQFIFKDWMKFKANDPKYPSSMLMEKSYTLNSISDTEQFIKRKLFAIDMHKDTPEPQLPECTDKELWRGSPVWKYYKNPESAALKKRATKNFDTPQEANLRFVQDGSIGLVVENKPQPTACLYCNVSGSCTQKDKYIADGSLKL